MLIGVIGVMAILLGRAWATPCSMTPSWDCQAVVQDTEPDRRYATVSIASDNSGEVEVVWENYDDGDVRGILFGRRRSAGGVLSPNLIVVSNQFVESRTAAGVLQPTLLVVTESRSSLGKTSILVMEKSCVADPESTDWSTGWTAYGLLAATLTIESSLGTAKHGNLDATPGGGTANIGFIFANGDTGVDSIVLGTRTYVCP